MVPTPDQIAMAAYYRWERRHFAHGRHGHDWLAAEQELLFAANYEVIARFRLDGITPRVLGDPDAARCRFCEQAAPRATFSGPKPAVPRVLGNAAIVSFEECDECREGYDESVGGDLDRFVRAVRASGAGEPGADDAPGFVPVAAFKGLTWAALSLLPEDEMQYFEGAVEWVVNPDHDLDCLAIDGLECIVHRLPEPGPFSWAALARREDDDAAMPYLLAFFGSGATVLQVPIPLGNRDEDLDGVWTIPRVASPFGVGRGPLDASSVAIPLGSPRPIRSWLGAVRS